MQDSLASENFVDYSKYHEEYESLGGYAIESQAGKLLSGLGFSVSQLQTKGKRAIWWLADTIKSCSSTAARVRYFIT